MNLRDDQWERIKRLLPGKKGDHGRTAADNRFFVEVVLWMARSGAPWRDLPEGLGPWNNVYKRFARWQEQGMWQRVFAEDAVFEEVFYKGRNLVERFFCRIKHFRRIATRYDKLDRRYEAFIAIAAAWIWLA